ncbi:MAG: Asp23/Gls24 family envelope stress response protein [Bacillota bacterium]|nr:MAG: Asp23/Gls24 family envelope stress response protein [Bacillota bacterium]
MARVSPKLQRQSSPGQAVSGAKPVPERGSGVPSTQTPVGRITIADEVVATIAGMAATECYGIVGMAARRLKDGIAELLGRENLSRGVQVAFKDGDIRIDLNVIIGYGTRISEVAHNVSSQVRYRVEDSTGLRVRSVNINVQGVRAIGER